MSSSAVIEIGPYHFTEQDAVRTMSNLDGLWRQMMDRRVSATTDALGAELRARLAMDPELETALNDAWITLRAASDVLRAEGQMPPMSTGTVAQLNLSKGGVPKLATNAVDVGFRGVIGDLQRVRVHHGRPWQALCIYSAEVIEMLRFEGHPIRPGSVGENITVSGLDWSVVRPGVLLQIGGVLAHVQAYAEPCRSNAQFFTGGDFQRMNVDRGPVSRIYATVVRPGRIQAGDRVVLEPDLGSTFGSTFGSTIRSTIEDLTAQTKDRRASPA
jgi:MOSC domain-containing protein YiiM